MGLIQVGGKLIPAVCGMMEDVVTKHPCVSSDTFARFAEDHTTRDLALVRRVPPMSNGICDACRACERQRGFETPKSGQCVQIPFSQSFEAHCLCPVISMTSCFFQLIYKAIISNTTPSHPGFFAICHQIKPPRITLGATKK